jgi:hypothetical protein
LGGIPAGLEVAAETRMTRRRIANLSCMLAFTFFIGCAADSATETDDGLGEATSEARPEWWPLGSGCADTIGVAPDDVLWVTGCDGRLDNSVWYMRYEVSCFDGICGDFPVWHDARGAGARIAVYNNGNVFVVTSNGVVYGATWTNQSGVALPTGRWRNPIAAPDCVNQFTGYVADAEGLTFETPTRTIPDDGVWRYFSTVCNADLNGNSAIRRLQGYFFQTPWLSANGAGQLLATFYRPVGSSPQVTLVTSATDGTMWTYNESRQEFSEMTAPGPTYSLTDHFAATDDGVYRYDDATGGWSWYIENTTPTGRIKQIAHAGVKHVVLANGTAMNIGPSSLWGVDDSGQIYTALTIAQPR